MENSITFNEFSLKERNVPLSPAGHLFPVPTVRLQLLTKRYFDLPEVTNGAHCDRCFMFCSNTVLDPRYCREAAIHNEKKIDPISNTRTIHETCIQEKEIMA
jgi:hypothetical protein